MMKMGNENVTNYFSLDVRAFFLVFKRRFQFSFYSKKVPLVGSTTAIKYKVSMICLDSL